MRWSRTPIAINTQKGLFIPFVLAVGVFLCGLVLGAISLRTLNPLVQQELNQYLTFYLKEVSACAGALFPLKPGFKPSRYRHVHWASSGCSG